MPILSIPNPPAESNLRRLPLDKPAKPDALHAALHKVMAHHGASSLAEPKQPRNMSRSNKRGRAQSTLPLAFLGLRAAHISAFSRIYTNLLALIDERRHLYHQPRLQFCR